jgi:outer membrane protein OmpA-like peptidoglycan-associated protein
MSVSNGYGFYKGMYEYYEKDDSLDDSFRLVNEYESRFYQDRYGNMIIQSNILMPDLRSVPSFSSNDIKPGDSWKSPGEEIHEGVLYGSNLIISRFDVNYIYLGEEKIEGTMYSKFSIDYHIINYPDNDPDIFSLTGYTHITYYWDVSNRCPSSYKDEYSLLYTFRTGETLFYKSRSEGRGELINEPPAEQKKEILNQMTNVISKNSGISVSEIPDGILLSLGNILFDFNSYTLKREYEKKLSAVSDILKKYPAIDLSVSGFTDNIGEESYNLELSGRRARTVTDFLIKNGIFPTRLSYAGYGSSNPVYSNDTEEGRSMNRRVEIKIMTRE